MAKLREQIPYYRANSKTKRWHWEPPKWARDLGMKSVAYGEDTPESREDARLQNRKLAALKMGRTEAEPRYPAGSLGSFWLKWRKTESWRRKSAGTREEFERAWKRIGPELGSKLITRITVNDLERFQLKLEAETTEYERWRTIKKLRELLNTAQTYGVISKAPAASLPNPQPRGRSQIFLAHEVVRLIKRAEAMGDETMAAAIALIWETAVSPVDARTLIPAELFMSKQGPYIHRPRRKTQAEIYAPIPQALYDTLMRLAAPDGAEALPTAPIFRRPDGRPFTGPQDFAKRFSRIRKAEFGKSESRKMLDLRRGANIEMTVGGADRKDRASALANAMDTDDRLHLTYTPPTLEAARRAQKSRAAGRKYMEQARTHEEQDSETPVSEIRRRV